MKAPEIPLPVQVVPCRYCRKPLRDGATYCTHCSHYQWRSRNFLPHLGGLVALAALLLTAYPFVTLFLFPKTGLQLVALNSSSGYAFANPGKVEVFVEGIELRALDRSESLALYLTVPPGGFTSYKLTQNELSDRAPGGKAMTCRALGGKGDDPCKTISVDPSKYGLIFLSEDNVTSQQIGQEIEDLAHFDATVTVFYRSANDKTSRQLEVQLTVILVPVQE